MFGSLTFGGAKYVGTKSCGMCHKKDDVGNQIKVWKNSKHANAYKALQTEKANEIAKGKGFKTKAVDTKECLKCHATGYDVNKSMLEEDFDIADGVQCETCHGAGSEFNTKNIMKDKNLAEQKGLLLYKNPNDLCVKCHNKQSPTFKGFNFKTEWAKIEHLDPKVKK
ncbi:MAG: cytochrome C554 [Ignavibacteria bacterium CG_4_8_14_3_um_filter_37_9]|nr:cytochrome C554 [Ignavibacteria bacterium]OIO24010.1 MAG: cytochrome C554 [Ignavibacteria bacterium CG1_02_37_35]PIP78065.1 MAG: cytochrome C554 [Ignavibacteria bacterium CG22_combo_CG10-13_8_21_14_all_37_15]PIS44526.1 MAG: cytochrome C554 [Ignavibacteria bacterium CG08_land_8_20_14_0_20_37_9]PIW98791.1 MAG: cytochrome C554 [Ignavibacteria bacterium CG_4_8_14_3_um_filter_37_9]PIX93959.1 MAG: cytochrome C554 [Ignavibacteria bacterium CG_4_10_14_3_um_filter_37_18]PJC59808.1 MAG: cytochrome C